MTESHTSSTVSTSSPLSRFGVQKNRLSFTSQESNFEDLKNEFKQRGLTYKDFPNINMYVLKYNRKSADLSDPDVRRCRGLVFDRTSHEIVGTCPEKSLPLGNFDTDSEAVIYEEFYDGTNVNVFYHNDTWHISTRSSIGAATSFNTEKTFRDMFFESLKFSLEQLDKTIMYSFVLLHKDNRIVCPIPENRVVLVEARGRVEDNTIVNLDLPEVRKYLIDTCCLAEDSIHIPKTYRFDTLEAAKTHVKSLGIESQGLVLKLLDENVRGKIRGETYSHARLIKGNTSNLFERYLHVRKNRQIKIYLRYFPEADEEFRKYNRDINNLVNDLHFTYIRCFIRKELEHKDCKYVFKPMIYALHKYHLTEGAIITREEAYIYFCELPVEKQLFVFENLNTVPVSVDKNMEETSN